MVRLSFTLNVPDFFYFFLFFGGTHLFLARTGSEARWPVNSVSYFVATHALFHTRSGGIPQRHKTAYPQPAFLGIHSPDT